MHHRRSKAKEVGNVAIGGAIAGILCASVDEATHYSRENEKITRAAHSPAKYYCHPGKRNGSRAETKTCAG
jgi:hypothetical protein